MTEGLGKRKMNDMDSKGDLNIFEWNIANFKEALEKTGEKITSPVFTGKCSDQPNSFWKIELYPKEKDGISLEDYIDVFLCFVKELNGHMPVIKVKPEFFLLDKDQHEMYRSEDENVVEFGIEDDSLGYSMATHSELLDDKNRCLEDNVLRVRVNLWIQNVEMNLPAKPASTIQKKLKLQKDLCLLLDSSKLSDVDILVDGATLKAHKAILSSRSPVFDAMFQTDMTESRTNTIEMEDFSAKTVKGMLEFMYSENMESVEDDYMELLKIAEKYELAELKEACNKEAILKISVENVMELLIIGDMYNAPELKSKALDFIGSSKANPVFSQGKENGTFEKFAKEHPLLLLEMYQNMRNDRTSVVTRFTTNVVD